MEEVWGEPVAAGEERKTEALNPEGSRQEVRFVCLFKKNHFIFLLKQYTLPINSLSIAEKLKKKKY